MKRHIREAMDWVGEHAGVTEVTIEHGGCHPKIHFQFKGQACKIPISSSPSCAHWFKNFQQLFRRWFIRGDMIAVAEGLGSGQNRR